VFDLSSLILYIVIILLCAKPLGWYMARVYEGQACGLNRILQPIENFIYKISAVNAQQEMTWKTYLISMLVFNLLGLLFLYVLQRWQMHFPLNPENFPAVDPNLSFNTAISFITNTNWQAYSGETTLSYFTQMLGLTVQNFLSAATGMSLMVALFRGIARHETQALGNFWVDTVRGTLYILLPLSFILAIALVSQGVIQNFKAYETVSLIEPTQYQIDSQIKTITQQTIPMGPVASQVAIKQLGTNGGGFFNTNSAHPFENPTPLSNFLEMLALILIPAALCYTFGMMVKDKRQGWSLLLVMVLFFLPFAGVAIFAEQQGNPEFARMGIQQNYQAGLQSGGNMEGKEVRFGATTSALWAAATTASSNGSVNSMHDSFTPMGGFIPLWLMHLGEVIFGGVGSGLYGMLMLVIISVFVVGLMVGRTPEYLGKKIEPFEMKMASVAVLIMPLVVLLLTAIAVITSAGTSSTANPGAHGFTEILYAFTSLGNNNGSAFAGLNANTPFYNIAGGFVMLVARFWIAIPTLAIAGSLAQKKLIPASAGTLSTHTPLFITILMAVILILGALSFLPSLALGPIAEQLTQGASYGQ
jgi:K+-transporting ATPase ATPase A chain